MNYRQDRRKGNKRTMPPISKALPESKAILDVQDLGVVRSRTEILKGITWRVRPDEHWVILGPNGSGKTSLLSALTGYLMPTSGVIDVLGHRYGSSDWRELRKRVGLVSSSNRQLMAETEPALEKVVSGRYAEIDLWRKLTDRDRRKATNILAQVECAGLGERPWKFLSQGERQRILIGRALMADPALLILDEPCAGLDPVARERFLRWIERLGSGQNTPTLVLVTHHVEEIMPVFTHALLLRNGQMTACGVKADVLTSAALSLAFDTRVRARKTRGRYSLAVATARDRLII